MQATRACLPDSRRRESFDSRPADDGVGAAGDQRGHVEGGSYGRSAAGDGSAAAPDAAVAIDRRHADEGLRFCAGRGVRVPAVRR